MKTSGNVNGVMNITNINGVMNITSNNSRKIFMVYYAFIKMWGNKGVCTNLALYLYSLHYPKPCMRRDSSDTECVWPKDCRHAHQASNDCPCYK